MMRHKMMDMLRHGVLRLSLGLACAGGLPLAAHALTAPQALELAAGDADERVAQLLQLAASDDARARAMLGNEAKSVFESVWLQIGLPHGVTLAGGRAPVVSWRSLSPEPA